MEFTFGIIYRPEASNRVADAISRKDLVTSYNSLSMWFWKNRDKPKEEIARYDLLTKMKAYLIEDPQLHKGIFVF